MLSLSTSVGEFTTDCISKSKLGAYTQARYCSAKFNFGSVGVPQHFDVSSELKN